MRTYRIRLVPPIISQELALYQRLIETLQIDKKTCTQHMKKIKLLCSYEFGMSCFLRFFIFLSQFPPFNMYSQYTLCGYKYKS